MTVPSFLHVRPGNPVFASPLLLALVFSYGCSSSPTDSTSSADDQITAGYYIQANVDGTIVTNQIVQNNASFGIGESFHGSGHETTTGDGYMEVQKFSFVKVDITSLTTDPSYHSLVVGFVKVFPEQPFDSDLDALITMGSMEYGSEQAERDGVVIQWVDAAGTLWSSDLGAADQTGSSFTVTTNTKIEYQPGQSVYGQYITRGTFSCTLYDGNGNSIHIRDGRFTLHTIQY